MTMSKAQGALTVGYVGKIGKRLDLDLILRMASNFPDIQFIFAGPFLDKEYLEPMKSMRNIALLGDVHYANVPELLQTFDVGWVPHRVGNGEVGGDVIKIYEYRAAGLPVLSTPILEAGERGLDCVEVLSAEQQHLQFESWKNSDLELHELQRTFPKSTLGNLRLSTFLT